MFYLVQSVASFPIQFNSKNSQKSYSSFNQDNYLSSESIEQNNFTRDYIDHHLFLRSESIIIQECLFSHIKEKDSSGGAIFIFGPGKTSAFIKSTGFYMCSSSSEGGAIYANLNSIDLKLSCFHDCQIAENHGSSLYCISKTINYKDLIICQVSKSSNYLSTFYLICHNPELGHINFTNVASSLNNGISAISLSSLEQSSLAQISSIYFSSNSGSSLMSIKGFEISIEHLSFDKDNQLTKSIFSFSNCKAKILYSSFFDFQVPFIQKDGENDIQVLDCNFQGNPVLDSQTKCNFNQINLTLQLEPFETNHCWNLQYKRKKFTFSTLHYLIFFLVIMWIIIIGYLCKTRDNKHQRLISEENTSSDIRIEESDSETPDQKEELNSL